MENTLTEQQANSIAREWVDDRCPLPTGKHHPWQKHWLMNKLAVLCIAETIKQKQGELDLNSRLAATYDILESISESSMPDANQRARLKVNTDDERDLYQINEQKRPIWHMHDPKISFIEGFKSEHYLQYDKDLLNETIADYLSRPWLRHPFLDWVLVDMMVTAELCGFGKTVKEVRFGHGVLLRANGNIRKMHKFYSLHLGKRLLTFIAIPISAIWAADNYGYNKTAQILGSIYGLMVFLYVANKFSKFILRIFNSIMGRPDPRLKPYALWEKMYEVWQHLRAPVLNPILIRELMSKTTSEGARWDSATWSIIDRAIAIDPAVWIVRLDQLSLPNKRNGKAGTDAMGVIEPADPKMLEICKAIVKDCG